MYISCLVRSGFTTIFQLRTPVPPSMAIVLTLPGICEFHGSVRLWDRGSSGKAWQWVSSLGQGSSLRVRSCPLWATQVLPENPEEFSHIMVTNEAGSMVASRTKCMFPVK